MPSHVMSGKELREVDPDATTKVADLFVRIPR
jgi:hypothetical protein